MQAALQFLEQSEQFLHLSSLKWIFRNEKRAKKLSMVPTGQMVLQYVLPPRQANITRITKVTAAMMNTGNERIHVSTV